MFVAITAACGHHGQPVAITAFAWPSRLVAITARSRYCSLWPSRHYQHGPWSSRLGPCSPWLRRERDKKLYYSGRVNWAPAGRQAGFLQAVLAKLSVSWRDACIMSD